MEEQKTFEQAKAEQAEVAWRLPEWPLQGYGGTDATRSLHSRFGDLHQLHKRHARELEKIRKDPMIPSESRNLLVAQEQKRASEDLKAWREQLERSRADLQALRDRMLSDVRGVDQSVQAEVRALLRSLKPSERLNAAQEAIRTRDVRTLAAITSTPPTFQQLDEETVTNAARSLNPELAAAFDEASTALQAAEAGASILADRIAGRETPSHADQAARVRAQGLKDAAKGVAERVFG